MAIDVREATVEDVEAFRSLRLAALKLAPDSYRRLYADEVDVPYGRWEAFIERNAEDPDAGVFLAMREGGPAGMMFLGADRAAETMSIGGMWVEPEHRRHGVAHAMVVAATEWGCLRSARIARLVAREPVQVLKPELGTEPRVFYIAADHGVMGHVAKEI